MTRNEHKKYCVLEISLVYLVSCCPLSPHLISLLSSTSLIASSLNPGKLLLSCSHNRCKLMWFHIMSWHLHCAPLYFLLNERLNRALMKCRQWLELMAMTAANTKHNTVSVWETQQTRLFLPITRLSFCTSPSIVPSKYPSQCLADSALLSFENLPNYNIFKCK